VRTRPLFFRRRFETVIRECPRFADIWNVYREDHRMPQAVSSKVMMLLPHARA
jgi:hypothetical protein